MRTVVYKDKDIPEKAYRKLLDEYTAFLEKYAKLTPVFFTEDYDFSDYPVETDGDGDSVLRPTFLQDIADDVTEVHGNYGTDHIVTLIHNKNWKSGKTATRKGIWGTNYSYKYGTFHIQYCRWDDKLANTFGTINHEQDHTYDALIRTEIGIDINPILGVSNYDKDVTHGASQKYEYIRHKENAEKLTKIAPYLQAAYRKRQERHDEYTQKLITIIGLLEKLVYLWKRKINQKNGV